MDTESIAVWAKRAREEAGYPSADSAARAAGLKESYVRQLEAGGIGTPGADKLAALEALYGSEAPRQPRRRALRGAAHEEMIDAYERGLLMGWDLRDRGAPRPSQSGRPADQ